MINVKVVGAHELKLDLARIREEAPKRLITIVKNSALKVERMVKLFLTNKTLKVRTGKLRSSVGTSLGINRARPTAYVAVNSVYGAIHEFGGVIKPREKKYLAIPLPGVKGAPRNYPHAFLVRTKGGQLLIAMKGAYRNVAGTGGKVQMARGNDLNVLFVLKKSVKMPRRPYLEKSLKEVSPDIDAYIGQEIERLLR